MVVGVLTNFVTWLQLTDEQLIDQALQQAAETAKDTKEAFLVQAIDSAKEAAEDVMVEAMTSPSSCRLELCFSKYRMKKKFLR